MREREGDREIDELLLRAVERAGQPVRLVKLVASLPKAFQTPPGRIGERVAALSRQGRITVWPGRPELIALESRDAWIRSRILQTLHVAGPLTLSELNRRLGTSLARYRPAVLASLCQEGLVKRHPRLGRRAPYALAPPDPATYLRPELEKLVRSLGRLGFSRAELWKALALLAVPPPPPSPAALIVESLETLDPDAAGGALVPLGELRRAALRAVPDRAVFDAALLELSSARKVRLVPHPRPAELSDEARDELLSDGRGGFFSAIGLEVPGGAGR